MNVNEPNNFSRQVGIDVLRGLCVLSVIMLHLNIHLPLVVSPPSAWAKVAFFSGYYGVMSFFVISGFLITRTSLTRWGRLSAIPLVNFYTLRAARILPSLLLLLLVLSFCHSLGIPQMTISADKTSLAGAWFAVLTFHFNWLEARVGYLPAPWDILWSLSVEEAFYLLFPLACRLLRSDRLLVLLLMGLIVLGPMARTPWWSSNEFWQSHGYFACADALAFGCLAALTAQHWRFTQRQAKIILVIGLTLVLFILVMRKSAWQLGLATHGLNASVLCMGLAMMLLAMPVMSTKVLSTWRGGFLAFIGRNSYEIYLTHMLVVLPVIALCLALGTALWWRVLCYVLAIVFSIGLGHLLAQYYSSPINRKWRKLNKLSLPRNLKI